MSRSELEQLATAIHAPADQIHRDIPHLHQRQHHISQLASRAARLAARSNDPGLKRVTDLARIAASQLDDATNHLLTTARKGEHYANTLVGEAPGTSTKPADTTTPEAPSSPPPESTDTDRTNGATASPPPAVNPYDWSGNNDRFNEGAGAELDEEGRWHVARDRAIAYAPTGGALVAVFAAHIPEPIRTIVGLLGVAAGALATWWNRRKPRRS